MDICEAFGLEQSRILVNHYAEVLGGNVTELGHEVLLEFRLPKKILEKMTTKMRVNHTYTEIGRQREEGHRHREMLRKPVRVPPQRPYQSGRGDLQV